MTARAVSLRRQWSRLRYQMATLLLIRPSMRLSMTPSRLGVCHCPILRDCRRLRQSGSRTLRHQIGPPSTRRDGYLSTPTDLSTAPSRLPHGDGYPPGERRRRLVGLHPPTRHPRSRSTSYRQSTVRRLRRQDVSRGHGVLIHWLHSPTVPTVAGHPPDTDWLLSTHLTVPHHRVVVEQCSRYRRLGDRNPVRSAWA
jgi:hypothetical protein